MLTRAAAAGLTGPPSTVPKNDPLTKADPWKAYSPTVEEFLGEKGDGSSSAANGLPPVAPLPGSQDFQVYVAGFGDDAPILEIYELMSEYVCDFLKDFPVEVLGVWEGHVGIRFHRTEGAAITKAMVDQREKFMYLGKALTFVETEASYASRFSIPNRAAMMAVDDSSSDSEAEEVTGDVSMQDLMRKLNTMEKREKRRSSKLKAELKSYADETARNAVSPLETALRNLTLDQSSLNDRVGALENATGSGVSEDFKRLFRTCEVADPAHTRIEFKGFKPEDLGAERVKKIQAALMSKLGGIEYQIAHLPAGPRGKRTQGNPYLQFSDELTRDDAFSKLSGKIVDLKNSKGDVIKLERMKTKIQKSRNFHLFTAFDMAKEKYGEKNVTIDTKMPLRSVDCKGETIFEQAEFALVGRFLGPAANWKFEDRKAKKSSKS